MKVKDVMDANVFTVRNDATYEEAARYFAKKDISGAPVVDPQNRVVGMLSEKDLFKALYPLYKNFHDNPELYLDYEAREEKIKEIRSDTVDKFFSKNIISVEPETPILRAGALMLAKGIHRLPVIKDGKLAGIVTREHIYQRILRHHLK